MGKLLNHQFWERFELEFGFEFAAFEIELEFECEFEFEFALEFQFEFEFELEFAFVLDGMALLYWMITPGARGALFTVNSSLPQIGLRLPRQQQHSRGWEFTNRHSKLSPAKSCERSAWAF